MKKLIIFLMLCSLTIINANAKELKLIKQNSKVQSNNNLKISYINSMDFQAEIDILQTKIDLLFNEIINWKKLFSYLKDRFKNEDKVNTYIYGPSYITEAYTMSILFQENFQNPEKFYPIIAKDKNEELIQTINSMENGIIPISLYIQNKACLPFDKRVKNAIKISDIDSNKYYTKKDDFIIISDEVRKPVIFQYADIIKDIDSIDSKNPSIVMAGKMWFAMGVNQYQDYANRLYKKLAPKSVIVLHPNTNHYNHFSYLFLTALEKAGFTPSSAVIKVKDSKCYVFEKN